MCRKFYILMLFLGLAFSAAAAQGRLKVQQKPVSFGKRSVSHRNIDVIIVHSACNSMGGDSCDVDLVIRQFKSYGVSSHYVVGRDGTIYQLVKEKDVSYHAGKSSLPDGRTALNTCSLGIELVCTPAMSPTEAQVVSLTTLVKDIKKRYRIKYVLRHSDIAPERKTDPWNFDWEGFLKRIEK